MEYEHSIEFWSNWSLRLRRKMTSSGCSKTAPASVSAMDESVKHRETIRRHLLVFVYAEACQEHKLPFANHSGANQQRCTNDYCLSIRQLLSHIQSCKNGRYCSGMWYSFLKLVSEGEETKKLILQLQTAPLRRPFLPTGEVALRRNVQCVFPSRKFSGKLVNMAL